MELMQKEEEMRLLKMEVSLAPQSARKLDAPPSFPQVDKLQKELTTHRHMMPEKQSLEEELVQHQNMVR